MAEAPRDQNHVPGVIAVSYLDGTTAVPVKINSSNGGFVIDTTHTVSGAVMAVATKAVRDGNFVASWNGVSSADATTIIPVFADPATGGILVDQ